MNTICGNLDIQGLVVALLTLIVILLILMRKQKMI